MRFKLELDFLLQAFYRNFWHIFLTRKSPKRCRSGRKLSPPAASLAVYWSLWRSHPSARPILHWSIRRSSGLPLRSSRRLSHPRKRRHFIYLFLPENLGIPQTNFEWNIPFSEWLQKSIFSLDRLLKLSPSHVYCVSSRGKAGNNYFQRLLWVHCTENPIYVFPEMKLYSLVPNS